MVNEGPDRVWGCDFFPVGPFVPSLSFYFFLSLLCTSDVPATDLAVKSEDGHSSGSEPGSGQSHGDDNVSEDGHHGEVDPENGGERADDGVRLARESSSSNPGAPPPLDFGSTTQQAASEQSAPETVAVSLTVNPGAPPPLPVEISTRVPHHLPATRDAPEVVVAAAAVSPEAGAEVASANGSGPDETFDGVEPTPDVDAESTLAEDAEPAPVVDDSADPILSVGADRTPGEDAESTAAEDAEPAPVVDDSADPIPSVGADRTRGEDLESTAAEDAEPAPVVDDSADPIPSVGADRTRGEDLESTAAEDAEPAPVDDSADPIPSAVAESTPVEDAELTPADSAEGIADDATPPTASPGGSVSGDGERDQAGGDDPSPESVPEEVPPGLDDSLSSIWSSSGVVLDEDLSEDDGPGDGSPPPDTVVEATYTDAHAAAAIRIQAIHRGNVARAATRPLIHEARLEAERDRQNAAAVVIQACVRGDAARRQYAKAKAARLAEAEAARLAEAEAVRMAEAEAVRMAEAGAVRVAEAESVEMAAAEPTTVDPATDAVPSTSTTTAAAGGAVQVEEAGDMVVDAGDDSDSDSFFGEMTDPYLLNRNGIS